MSMHTRYAGIIDLVLENSELHKMEMEEGCSPTFLLGLQKNGYSNITKELGDMIEKIIKEKS